jgi:putative transposase
MDNHVHLVVVPEKEESLSRGIGEAQRRYTRRVHFREGWRGYLWQGRFASFPMEERHLYAAVRYVERNPVRAGMVERAEDYRWSSARAHVQGVLDPLLSDFFMVSEVGNWSDYLRGEEGEKDLSDMRKRIKTGRPWMNAHFLQGFERKLGRRLLKMTPGPKAKHWL